MSHSWARVIVASSLTTVGGALILQNIGSALSDYSISVVHPQAEEGVCDGTHLPAPGGTSVTVTAPEGMLISGYCVKAGSIEQGNGP
ncbi:MAG: hypothetical protein M3431_02970, partial [Actinomycetota bacterium]|nr:hypothetical protein [Actinomycetota bacterium]